MKTNLYRSLQNVKIEREVADLYNSAIKEAFGISDDEITFPNGCDGYIRLCKKEDKDSKIDDNRGSRILAEYKLDVDLNSKINCAKVLIQAIYYLKRFEESLIKTPDVILIADRNECFVLSFNCLYNYLDEDVDWSISPSSAASKNIELVKKIANDPNINPFIYHINESFNFGEVVDDIKGIKENNSHKTRITEKNIENLYIYFIKSIIKHSNQIPTNKLVEYFIGSITNHENYYKHPVRPNTLVCNKTEYVEIVEKNYNAFFKHIKNDYSIEEKRFFTEISDRLIEDSNRRRKGEFFTPKILADIAQDRLSKELGSNWRNEYVVWDPCCGSKNLTRDYYFKHLYCSTLFEAELNIGQKYNSNNLSFQFDFLNDPFEIPNVPRELYLAFKNNKPIVFLMNPPYSAPSSSNHNKSKKGSTKTNVNKHAIDQNISIPNLYIQFIYRIMMLKERFNLTDVHIMMFTPTGFLNSVRVVNFRKQFFNNFKFENGVLFKGGLFEGVGSGLSIGLSMWSIGKTETKEFKFNAIEYDKNLSMVNNFNTVIECIDDIKTAADWIKSSEPKTLRVPKINKQLRSVDFDKNGYGHLPENYYGYFYRHSNGVSVRSKGVQFFSTSYAYEYGTPIDQTNVRRCCDIFAAHRSVDANWANSVNQFRIPNVDDPRYQEFSNDAIIYSIFHSWNQMSSIRNYKYGENLYNIDNKFFFMSCDDIRDLAIKYNNEYCYNDNIGINSPMYEILQNIKLSTEAQTVLDKARELVRKSFESREAFNEINPDIQINNWNCGYYQLKELWKIYYTEEYNEFINLYKILERKIQPMVYELGFLHK